MTASAQAQDVSNFQGHYNWAHAKAIIPNLVLGISRVTQGLGQNTNSPDPDASWNWQQLAAEGLDRGGYHFFDPRLDGAAQARYFVEAAGRLPGGLKPTDQLWLDNEAANGEPPSVVSAQAVAFMNELDKLAPHNPRGVYTFINFARSGYCRGLGTRWLWLAFPSATAPVGPPPWMAKEFVLWQWGQRDGTDADAFMGTVPEYRAWVNAFAPPPPVAQGPYRHVSDGTKTAAQIAAGRHETFQALVANSARYYDAHDLSVLEHVLVPKGVAYYTLNP